jgi:hypothetical protein
MNDRALVTLAIGQPCLANWQKYCEPNWQAYAHRHHLDLIVITQPLIQTTTGQPERPIPWQKCLIPSQPFAQKFAQVAILDADIAINPTAPNIFDQVT